MATSTEVSAASAAGGRRVRAALLASGLAIVVLGAGYWSYFNRRSDYLVNRDLRLLSVAAAQIGAGLESRKQIVRNFAESDYWNVSQYPSPEADAANLSRYLGDFTEIRRIDEMTQFPPPPDPRRRDGYVVQQNEREIAIDYRADVPTPAPHATGRLSLESLIAPVLDKPLFGVFDTVFLAAANGDVISQVQPHGSPPQRTILPAISRSVTRHDAGALTIATITSMRDRNVKDGKIDIAGLLAETRSTDVELYGGRYVLLTQPFTFAAPGSGNAPQHCIVGGLVARPHFLRDATEISSSLIELVVCSLLLLACCWPFLKLAFSGAGEPVTRADVVMGGVAAMLGAGLMALLLIDVYAYNHFKSAADDQQRAFARTMDTDVQAGIDRIALISEMLRSSTRRYALAFQNRNIRYAIGDYAKELPWYLRRQGTYRFYSSAAWVDDHGNQVAQFAMEGGKPPLPSVANRQYFRTLRDDSGSMHAWRRPDPHDPRLSLEFIIESVRALGTGDPQAVIALPVRDQALSRLKAFTVSFPFIEVTEHVGSPDLSYAIVDQNGDVVFGTDSDLNGLENVFVETDQDRQLRAAVAARQETFVDAKHWGEDTRVLVTPLENLPWTLLTFRDKRLLRTINLEALAVTMTFFLLYLGTVVLIVVGILLARPSYRMTWAWPQEQRLRQWKRLRLLYSVTAIGFLLAIYATAPVVRLAVTALVPLYAYFGTYLTLRDLKEDKRLAYGLVLVAWIAMTIAFAAGAVAAPFADDVVVSAGAAAVAVRSVLLLLLAIGVIAVVVTTKEMDRVRWREFARTYIACGVLFIVVMAVLPMLASFQAAVTMECQAMVKAGQLQMTDILLQRIELLASRQWGGWTNTSMAYATPFFFDSIWCVDRQATQQPCGSESTAWKAKLSSTTSFRDEGYILGGVERFLPFYSEGSILLHGIDSGAADDGSWRAVRAGRVTAVSRPFDLSYSTRRKITSQLDAELQGAKLRKQLPIVRGGIAAWASAIATRQASLTIISRVPSLLPEALRAADPIGPTPESLALPHEDENDRRRDQRPLPEPLRALVYLIAAGVAGGCILWAVRFTARRIFLYDLREPQWLETPLRPPLGDHIFLVHGGGSLSQLIVEADVDTLSFNDLRDGAPLADVDSAPPSTPWREQLLRIDSSGPKRTIVCKDFDVDLSDVELTRRKFALLESIVKLTDRTVIVSSRVAPPLFFTFLSDVDAPTRAQWQAVLSMFVWIDESRLLPRAKLRKADKSELPNAWERTKETYREIRAAIPTLPALIRERCNPRLVLLAIGDWFTQFTARGREQRDREELKRWIKAETKGSAFLASMRADLKRLTGGREQVVDELRERAERYYEALWAMCSRAERVVLYQVAHYGVVNCANRRMIRRLIARGLLRRDGELRLFNSTFALFVLGHRDEIRDECDEPDFHSTFDRVRIPIFVGILLVIGVLVGTQKELANATTTIVTALATGLPMIVKLIGTFTDRRVAAIER